MKIDDLNIGDKFKCKVDEDMEKPFTATVEKIYTNSALMHINEYDPADEDNVVELNNKIVVNAKALKPISKAKK